MDRAAGVRPRAERIGRFLYRWRAYTPLPLVLVVLLASRPTGWSIAAGIPLVLLGETLRIDSLRFIGGSSRSRVLGGESLVAEGPYARTRNPLYLGNLLLSTGLALFSGIPVLPPVLWILFAAQYAAIIRAEEAELARRFPEPFAAYTREVPRFFPRGWGRSIGTPRLGLRAALRVERRTLAAIGLLLGAMLLRAPLLGGRG